MSRSPLSAPWPAHLTTPRLLLRPVEAQDVPVISRLWTDPEVRRHLGGPVGAAEVAARERLCVGLLGVFAVVRYEGEEKGEGEGAAVMGLVSVETDTRRGSRAEVSYQLLPEFWGLGYAGEAVARAVTWVLDHVSVGPPSVVAMTQEANTRSRRLLERIGMRAVDTFVEFDAPQVMYSVDRTALRAPE
ncbi:GNAT family N-acetyltransferase [Streptomyces sp. NPDC058001]|uniref:GNAT family N-acetyltransferase n=1 Tax=Streptomyces sp. NPDC058001 TaxID=3346300 RepID=UPI0036E1EDE2